jgi:hypothetical protein
VADLQLRHSIATKPVWRDPRFADDLSAVGGTPSDILYPLRAPTRVVEECGVYPRRVDGEHSIWCDECGGEVHDALQLLNAQEERQEIAASNHESHSSLKALRRQPLQEINFKDLCRWDALAGEGTRLRVVIETDQTAIMDIERCKDSTGAAAKLNDRSTSLSGECSPNVTISLGPSVEVALVVEEPLPVQRAQRRGSQRIVSPAAFRFASELITSSAARLAIIAVDSAQSYGGDTSRMSMPAIGTRAAI